ncbi:MAG: hydrogenase maturation nickel metallochaperone HypA [Oscillospiraceae bacterium]|nr:hydrogenase maturation nickel metallochaperone HypA [Oscillospiraceae bacterium]
MHELGLCDALLKKVDSLVKENELEGVNSVTIEVGTLSGVIPRFMLDCWDAVIDGTAYSETKLIVNSIPGTARCADCGAEFTVDMENMKCPDCDGEHLIPTGGNGMTITEIEAY